MHFAPRKVEIGKKSDLILSTYGDPTRLPYTEESGVIHNILMDFDTAFGPDIDQTGLDEWVHELREANDAFNNLRYDRHETQQYAQAGRSKQERTNTDEAYHDLVEKINAYVILNGATNPLRSAINGINLMINAENALLKGRRTRSAGKADTPDEDEPDEE
ncbi:MAG: DUF6261 family protein [Tannerellaceae bacterium]|nr:DUF6261 family protein [Tannerellaceae bacterium]